MIEESGQRMWGNKPYHSLDYEIKSLYGHKLYKISLNGGMTCPNRDGNLDSRGCIFCSSGGSGDFAASPALNIVRQIEQGKSLIRSKMSSCDNTPSYIAYFQAYTNTYAPVEYLREIFMPAILHPDIAVLSIATRPDCLGEEVLALLQELNSIKPVWIELGLQTIHAPTADFIRRGYPLPVFHQAVQELNKINVSIIVHTILGLPQEGKHDILKTMEYLGHQPIHGIKLQLLHILKDTDLGALYKEGSFSYSITLEEYVDLVISCIEILPEQIVIHRITGDGPKNLLLSPLWSGNKKLVLNTIHHEMKQRNAWQGRLFR